MIYIVQQVKKRVFHIRHHYSLWSGNLAAEAQQVQKADPTITIKLLSAWYLMCLCACPPREFLGVLRRAFMTCFRMKRLLFNYFLFVCFVRDMKAECANVLFSKLNQFSVPFLYLTSCLTHSAPWRLMRPPSRIDYRPVCASTLWSWWEKHLWIVSRLEKLQAM